MFSSSKVNSITFKQLSDGNNPNYNNTLHKNLKQGGYTIKEYHQPFPNGHTVYLQFFSTDSNTPPTMAVYNYNTGAVISDASLTATLANSYTGTAGNLYFFNLIVALDSDYTNKTVYFTATQGATTLTSEPVCVKNLTEDIQNGTIKYIKYTNLDRNTADLNSYFVDWSSLTSSGKYMDFYFEATNREANISDESEVGDTFNSKFVISARSFTGEIIKTAGLPKHMIEKLAFATSLDEFTINGVSFIKEGEIDVEVFGGSTLFQADLTLSEKSTVGLNVDDLGIENTDTVAYHLDDNRDGITSNYTVTEPADYEATVAYVKQEGTPTASYITIKMGYTSGGSEIGQFRVYNNGKFNPVVMHQSPDPTSDVTIYVTVPAQAGSSLHIMFNFQKIIL